MRTEEVMVRGLLGGILLFIIGITAGVLLDAGIKTYIVILWCAAVLFLGLSAAGPLGMVPKQWGGRLLIVAVCLIILTTILQAKLIPICGDGSCSAGECSRCAKDCTPALCADNVCQPAVESCGTSDDCACTVSTACAPQRNTSDAKGCAPVSCGDGYCDGQESPESCCKDCGCVPGYICERNICYFEVPKVTVSPYLLTNRISAASLAGNPMLTDSNGNPRPLMRTDIRTTKPIENLTVTFSIPGLISNAIPVGTLYAEQVTDVRWHVRPDPRLAAVTADSARNITITVTYNDAFGNRYAMNRSVPITILSRNTLDGYGHIVLFTTALPTRSSTPNGIWDELGQQVIIERREDDRVQFAQETLARGAGSQRDIAVLLASAYTAAGLRTYIVESPEGTFVRVWNGDRFVMLDPSMIGTPFDEAISFKPGTGVYSIEQTFIARNFTRIEIG